MRWQKQRPRAFALHLFEEVIIKKHSPLGFVVRQMFSGTSPALSEALTLNTQRDPVGNCSAQIPSPIPTFWIGSSPRQGDHLAISGWCLGLSDCGEQITRVSASRRLWLAGCESASGCTGCTTTSVQAELPGQHSALRASSSARHKVTVWETAEMQQNSLLKEPVLDYCSSVAALRHSIH